MVATIGPQVTIFLKINNWILDEIYLGGGFNQGNPGALAESQSNSNDAFEEDEVLEDESIVL